MAFVMERVTESDHEKVFTAANKALISKYCGASDKWDPVDQSRRATDRERDAIFLKLRTWEPRDGIRRYLLILEGVPMVVPMGSGGSTGDVILPIDLPDQFKSRVEEVQATIRDAFVVHGYFGVHEPKDAFETPDPTFE